MDLDLKRPMTVDLFLEKGECLHCGRRTMTSCDFHVDWLVDPKEVYPRFVKLQDGSEMPGRLHADISRFSGRNDYDSDENLETHVTDPLNAWDRRCVHTYAESLSLHTQSVGSGKRKRVVIARNPEDLTNEVQRRTT